MRNIILVERYVGYYFGIQFDIDFIIDCIGSGCRGRSYYYYSLVVEDEIIIIFGAVRSYLFSALIDSAVDPFCAI